LAISFTSGRFELPDINFIKLSPIAASGPFKRGPGEGKGVARAQALA
jgi:hypothetical protein